MGMEGAPNESERVDDVEKARLMAEGTDWQRTQAAKIRAGAGGSETVEYWESGAESAEKLAETEYDAEKLASEMTNEELRVAVRESHEEAEAERAVNPKYVIGSKLDNLTRRAAAFANEAEVRRVADAEQTHEVASPLPKFVNKAANGMASYADNVVEILKAPFRRSK